MLSDVGDKQNFNSLMLNRWKVKLLEIFYDEKKMWFIEFSSPMLLHLITLAKWRKKPQVKKKTSSFTHFPFSSCGCFLLRVETREWTVDCDHYQENHSYRLTIDDVKQIRHSTNSIFHFFIMSVWRFWNAIEMKKGKSMFGEQKKRRSRKTLELVVCESYSIFSKRKMAGNRQPELWVIETVSLLLRSPRTTHSEMTT